MKSENAPGAGGAEGEGDGDLAKRPAATTRKIARNGDERKDAAGRFEKLYFSQRPKDYYRCTLGAAEPAPGEKREAKYEHVKKPLRSRDVRDHIGGRNGLLAPPVDADGMSQFGAIDVDDYDTSVVEIVAKMKRLGLPMLATESKSGGAHLWLFLQELMPAVAVRRVLHRIADELGLVSEVFPKQDRVEPGKHASAINLPYFGAERPAVRVKGGAMLIDEFVRAAERARLSPDQFEALCAQYPEPAPLAEPNTVTTTEDGASFARDRLAACAEEIAGAPSGARNETLNKKSFYVGTMVGRGWIERGEAERVLLAAAAKCGLPPDETAEVVRRALNDGAQKPHSDLSPIVSTSDHMGRARQLRAARRPNLMSWRGEFLDYNGGRYCVVDDDELRAEAARFLEHARTRTAKGGVEKFKLNRSTLAETTDALALVSHIPSTVTPSCWLDGRSDPSPSTLIAFPNGLLDYGTDEFHDPTPAFFTHQACRVDYEPGAEAPQRWLNFLDQIFAGETEQIEMLQEVFGYLLTANTSFQKVFLIIGPTRSGKGTVAKILRWLLADGAVGGSTMADFSNTFGLAPLIGRTVTTVDDLRIGRHSDRALITERLLTISGEGSMSVDRKYKKPWQGVLSTRFLIISNVLPDFADDSGAIASRFVTLNTRVSFEGREDRDLERKLRPDLPGILTWALDGLRRLRERGRFADPDRNAAMKLRLAGVASPVHAFVQDCCLLDDNALFGKDALYNAYVRWMRDNEMSPVDKAHFGEALLSAGNGKIRSTRTRVGGDRARQYRGIRLARARDDDESNLLKLAKTGGI